MPPAKRQGEAACQEAVSVCSWLCRQLTREGYRWHSDVRGGAATSPSRVGLAGVPVAVLGASGTPIFASPGVGSVVFVCASLVLCFQ